MKSPLKEVLTDDTYNSGKIYETGNAKGVDGKTTITKVIAGNSTTFLNNSPCYYY